MIKFLRFYQMKRKKRNMTNIDNSANNPRMNNKIHTILHKIVNQHMKNLDKEVKTKTHIIIIGQPLLVIILIL